MVRILMLADDLSGAAECGMACINAGLKVTVTLGAPAAGLSADVVAIDADTRRLGTAAAAERMRDLTQQYALHPELLLFKKIDSTLRGHLGSELAAVLQARRIVVPDSVAIIAPAFPAYGRTTLEGSHYVHGAPLHETEIWIREKTSASSFIPDLLSGSGLRCTSLNLATVRGAPAALDRALSASAEVTDAIVCDAETGEDLRGIAAAAAKLRGRAVWVGSAGLAHELPAAFGFALRADAPVAQLPQRHAPILFVVGSANQTTRRQVAALVEASDIGSIVVPPGVLLEGTRGPEWGRFRAQIESVVQLGSDLVLTCGTEVQVDVSDRARLSHSLGEMSASLRGRVGALVLSGGETARNVLERWGVAGLQLYGELERGVPISQTSSDLLQPITVITKAGDFGQVSTFRRCHEWLSQDGVLG